MSGSATVPRWLWLAFIGATLLYGVPAVWLLMSYMQPAYDLGIYDQAVWLLANGERLITVAGIDVNSAHFSPILYVISPIAWVPGGAVPELVVQSLMIGSGVFPAWKLARSLDQDPRWFALVYAIHPAIIGGSWFGWRPWNIAVPVFMWLTWWVVTHPTWMRVSVAGLSMLIFREDLAVWVGLLALILFLTKQIKWPTLLKSGLLLGAATAIVAFVVLPALSFVDGYYFTSSTQVSGGSGVNLATSAVTRVVFLLGPLALMPRRLNWRLLAPLAVPILGLLLRGGNSLTTFFHYDMMFVPLLLVVVGLSTKVSYRPIVLTLASVVVLLGLGALRPFPPQGGGNPFRYDSEIVAAFDEARSLIDAHPASDTASMSLPGVLVPHYSERSNVFIYPFPVDVWRDSEGEEPPLSINFACPEPNFVVARPQSITPPWNQAMEVGYTRTEFASGRVSLWTRDSLAGNEPCTAVYLDTR